MSRVLKFRAWDDKGKYWYPAETMKDFFNYLSEEFAIVADWFNKDAISLEQYTGLKDKNGKEIYEGDIVKMPDWQVKPKYEKVRFAKLSCGFEPFVCGCFECIAPDGEEVEVIGNIHENPELLEG